jgi:serine/threonine protein kinase
MSVVYLGYDEQLGRRIALKVLSQELSEDDAFRARFARESQLAAGLEHPNIVPVYEAGESDGLLYIAMRYVEGTDLRGLVKRTGTLHPDHALRLLRPIAAALDLAHRRGLVHRDVKPANILISTDDRGTEHSYLSDFGLSKHTSSHSGLTKTGQFMGTIDYVAPEQIQGGSEVDGRTDQYSLACVLFEVLTGDVPFERETDVARLFGHLQDQPPSATRRRPQLPDAIDDVLAHGMAKSRDERYENCSDLIEAASSAFQKRPQEVAVPPPIDRTIAAPPPPPPETVQPFRPPESSPPFRPPESSPPVPSAERSRRSRMPLILAASIGILVAIAAVVVVPRLVGGDEDQADQGTDSSQGDQTGPEATGPETTGPEPTGTPGVFVDDFSDPTSGWGLRQATSIQANYVRDQYQMSVDGGYFWIELKDHGVSESSRIVVEARPVSSGYTFYGVTCRGIDPPPAPNPRAYYFEISTKGDYAIGQFEVATRAGFENFVIDTSPAINRGTEMNEIEATCKQQGDALKLTLVVNGEFVDSVRVDRPFPAGRVGLNVHVGGQNDIGVVTFDNFELTEL